VTFEEFIVNFVKKLKKETLQKLFIMAKNIDPYRFFLQGTTNQSTTEKVKRCL